MADPGIRTPNLALSEAPAHDVMAHVDVGGGVLALRRQTLEVFIQRLLGLAGLDPSIIADLSTRLTQEITDRAAGDTALSNRINAILAGAPDQFNTFLEAYTAVTGLDTRLTALQALVPKTPASFADRCSFGIVLGEAAQESTTESGRLRMLATRAATWRPDPVSGVLKARARSNLIAPPTYASPIVTGSGFTGEADPRNIDLFFQYGQSNADKGSDQTDAPFANIVLPGYEDRCLSTMIGPSCVYYRFGAAGLYDCREFSNGAMGLESSCTSTIVHLARNIQQGSAQYPKIGIFNASIGAQTIENLSPGGGDGGVSGFQALTWAVQDAVAACKREGLIPRVRGVIFRGNEIASVPEMYAGQIVNLKRAIDNVVAQANPEQVGRIVMFLDCPRYVDSRFPYEHRQARAHRLAALLDRDIVQCQPYYWCHGNGSTIHMDCQGQNQIGQAVGRAIYHHIYGTGWRALTALEAWMVNRQTVQVRFQLPPGATSLAWDLTGQYVGTTGFAPKSFRGIQVADADTLASGVETDCPAITSATIIADADGIGNNIQFTLDKAMPAGRGLICGATRRNPASVNAGDDPAFNARTLLVDNTADPSLYIRVDTANGYAVKRDGTGTPQVQPNFCMPFSLPLNA